MNAGGDGNLAEAEAPSPHSPHATNSLNYLDDCSVQFGGNGSYGGLSDVHMETGVKASHCTY